MHDVLPLVYEYVGFVKDIQRKIGWCMRPPDGEETPFGDDEDMAIFMQKRWCQHIIVCLFTLFDTPTRVLRGRKIIESCIFV